MKALLIVLSESKAREGLTFGSPGKPGLGTLPHTSNKRSTGEVGKEFIQYKYIGKTSSLGLLTRVLGLNRGRIRAEGKRYVCIVKQLIIISGLVRLSFLGSC